MQKRFLLTIKVNIFHNLHLYGLLVDLDVVVDHLKRKMIYLKNIIMYQVQVT